MHQNRIDYSLKEYQKIILSRWNSTILWLTERNPVPFRQLYFARPTPKTIWLPGKPRQKYFNILFRKLSHQISNDDRKYSFATLTYSTKLYSPQFASSLLGSHIKEFIRLVRKRYPGIQYFWVIELTKNLMPHFHIVFRGFVHWKIIRAIWKKITGNRVTNIKKIPGKNISKYICSYVSKSSKHNEEQFSFIFKHIDRIYGSSRKFFANSTSTYIPKYIALAISFNLYYSPKYIFNSNNQDFWDIPVDFWYPLLCYNIYIPRMLINNQNSFNARLSLLDYFPDSSPYFNLADKYFNI